MQIYVDRDVAVFNSPAEYANDEFLNEEGDEFTLLSVEILGANTYRIINGVPVLVAIAQAVGTTLDEDTEQ